MGMAHDNIKYYFKEFVIKLIAFVFPVSLFVGMPLSALSLSIKLQSFVI
jgi:hypothetical protein